MAKRKPCSALVALMVASATLAASTAAVSSHAQHDGEGKMLDKKSGWSMKDVEQEKSLVKGPAKLEKCYGVAMKGKNDCSTYAGQHKHACAGVARTDRNTHEWMYVLKGNCGRLGGDLEPGVKKS